MSHYFIRHDKKVEFLCNSYNFLKLSFCEYLANRIVRRVDNDHLGADGYSVARERYDITFCACINHCHPYRSSSKSIFQSLLLRPTFGCDGGWSGTKMGLPPLKVTKRRYCSK